MGNMTKQKGGCGPRPTGAGLGATAGLPARGAWGWPPRPAGAWAGRFNRLARVGTPGMGCAPRHGGPRVASHGYAPRMRQLSWLPTAALTVPAAPGAARAFFGPSSGGFALHNRVGQQYLVGGIPVFQAVNQQHGPGGAALQQIVIQGG